MYVLFVREHWTWKMIPNCPGRYVVKKNQHITKLNLDELLAASLETIQDKNIEIYHTQSPKILDAVHVAVFPNEGGGIITYCKSTGEFVHTLNTQSGLARKLTGLELAHLLNFT